VIIRPGPDRIGPGAAPGGLVVHIYDTRDASLVTFAPIALSGDADAIAADHAHDVGKLLPPGVDVCVVFYDGDTGQRMVPPWAFGADVRQEE
jgi:hypothetical protein